MDDRRDVNRGFEALVSLEVNEQGMRMPVNMLNSK